jgi:uncharacterized protein YkwD
MPAAANLRAAEAAAVCLINEFRVKRGLRPLRPNPLLHRAASRHSHSMVRDHFFSHTGVDGSTADSRVRAAGYLRHEASYYYLGEDIGAASGDLATPAAMIRGWLASPAHRYFIAHRSFRDIGLAIAPGSPFGEPDSATYTADFGYEKKPKRRHRS